MFTSLLVGLDGSSHAEVALAQAILVGKRFRSRIVLAHVSPPQGRTGEMSLGAPWMEWVAGHSPVTREEREEAARRMLEDSAGAVRRAGLEVETAWRTGEVVDELRELGEQVGVIVVGRIGYRGALADEEVGPDTRTLLRRASQPVLVCASMPMPMDRVLVGYTGSAASEAALAYAARFAGISGAHLDVLQLPSPRGTTPELSPRTSGALAQAPLDFELHEVSGDPESALLDAIPRFGANAVFTEAEREEGQWLVPPQAETILRSADVPVLVHPLPVTPSARATLADRRAASG
jgi:nucleotide-binding universal stress UspA family protein